MKQWIILLKRLGYRIFQPFILFLTSNKMASALPVHYLPDPPTLTTTVRRRLRKLCNHVYPFLTQAMLDVSRMLRDQERVVGPIKMEYQEHQMPIALSGGDFMSKGSADAKVKELLEVISALRGTLCEYDGVGCSASKSNIGCLFFQSEEIQWAEYDRVCQELKNRGKQIECVEEVLRKTKTASKLNFVNFLEGGPSTLCDYSDFTANFDNFNLNLNVE
ncbi:unnamed protein product [Cylicocyclus nassatus]|uniref:Uncharacterized protein n=1 Tax=Cylicocyclus nassatus TaxID=53992 RepID=A0AA36DJ68_CYLNA|nr:unnamed protein product [Cylicocyclus nassatus]